MLRWLVALLLVAGSSAARAEDEAAEKAQARMLLSQGNTLFEKGDLRGALVDFRAAYRLYPSPKLLVNAAAAERELGDLAGAATDLRHFIDDQPVDDDPFLVERARSDLRGLERRVARIGISAWPKGSQLDVDGRAGRDPTYVRPGSHSLRARTPAGASVQSEVELAAGQVFELAVPAGALLAAPSGVVTKPAPASSRRALMIGLLVSAGALAVAGVVVGVVLATTQPPPLKGDLGTIPFMNFH
jgi:hypothetical protein